MKTQRGFSLVELVVVIVVLGILGAMASLFIRGPVLAYFSNIGRAQLTDNADLVLRRLSRELQDALPNSVRVAAAGGRVFVEFVPVDEVGRYRAASSPGAEPAGADPLETGNAEDTQFQVLGRPVMVLPSAQLVIYNLGFAPFDVYAGQNRRLVTTAPGSASVLSFAGTGTAWPGASPENRFYLVRTPVTYACTPNSDGSGRLERVAGYSLTALQPVDLDAPPLAQGARSLVGAAVAGCTAELGPVLANVNGVALSLTLGAPAGQVTLFTQVHLPQTP